MKKTWIVLATIAFALVSCNNEILDNTTDVNTASRTKIVFELTANHPDGATTKAVKTGWESGDVIYVFFNNVAAPKYLKMSYDGSVWSTTEMDGASTGSLGLTEGATGTMRAVYLPFGNALTIGTGTDGTSFTFSETTYSYYLTATLDYTVTSGKVSGAFNMTIPDGYIQFFLNDENASFSTEIEIREPHLTPQGIASIAANGTITHTDVAHGAPLPGYVYDKAVKQDGESKGYLFSGILASGARNNTTNYDFTLVSGGWQGMYYRVAFLERSWYNGATYGRALIMPALDEWMKITDYKPIDLGIDVGGKRIYWCSRNLGATSDGPADNSNTYGKYYTWDERNSDFVTTFGASSKWRVPTESEWVALSESTNIVDIKEIYHGDILYQRIINYNSWDDTSKGLIAKSEVEGKTDRYIFLPAAGQKEGNVNNAATNTGSKGYYWTSTPANTTNWDTSYYAYFDSKAFGTVNYYRNVWFSVRPVSE